VWSRKSALTLLANLGEERRGQDGNDPRREKKRDELDLVRRVVVRDEMSAGEIQSSRVFSLERVDESDHGVSLSSWGERKDRREVS